MSEVPSELLLRLHGQVIPQSFNVGFIALSYIVSLIGAACTLELLNRRTSHKGMFNHLLLLSSAVSMGGIAIWCMHFVGNRAIELGSGEDELQIAYSSGFTALSFFVPIIVLLLAFVAIGTNNTVSWWRVTIGGVMAGSAICGMHYLGNHSIENYTCIYALPNVVGSAIIAVAASIVSLALFFVFRAAWTNAWWKRLACSVVLAGAVSGMHWCAATGTKYQLKSLDAVSSEPSRNTTVIIVICLSVLACCIMAGVAIYSARTTRRYANKAQQVVLASAVFDKGGRVLVNPDGLLPTEKITDSFVEKDARDTFSIAHPLFHWMFRASRNWPSVVSLVGAMEHHLAHAPRVSKDRDARGVVQLIDEQGEVTDNYDILLRELFCVAAQGLAEKMKEKLPSVGILWDDILPTGGSYVRQAADNSPGQGASVAKENLAEKGLQPGKQFLGRGSLMFLVRRVQSERDVAKLEAAGYRFAEIRQVGNIISSGMQIQCSDLEAKMRSMAVYADHSSHLQPGIHLGFFGIQARVGSFGFDVLVRKGARNLLPSVQLPFNHLEAGHLELLQQLEGTMVSSLSKKLDGLTRPSAGGRMFLAQLLGGIESLRSCVGDAIVEEAILSSKVVTLPLPPRVKDGEDGEATNGSSGSLHQADGAVMISLRLVIPIHVKVNCEKCEFVPLNFFKVHQLVARDDLKQLAFAQTMHRQFAPLAKAEQDEKATTGVQTKRFSSSSRFGRLSRTGRSFATDSDGNPIPTVVGRSRSSSHSRDTGSTLRLWPGGGSSDHGHGHDHNSAGESVEPPPAYGIQDGASPQSSTAFGGIMVSEEIRVEIHEAGELRAGGSPRDKSQSQSRLSSFPSRMSRRNRGKVLDNGSLEGGAAARNCGDGGKPVEMTLMQETGDGVHTGPGHLVSYVGAEKPQDGTTFVDELFAACIDSR